MKKDISSRLSHKSPYGGIATNRSQQLDLLIVVDQMLTGFDSKWVNTLYLDKIIDYESIIQAFSRTNRLFGPDKPFGVIRYYRKPHTMKRNVDAAVKLYSGDKPIGLFADQLPRNLERLNDCFTEINAIFSAAGIADFAKLPDDLAARAAFAKQFNQFSAILEAAKIQGFTWDKTVYEFDTEPKQLIAVAITKLQYLTLLQRYKELGAGGGGAGESIPFDIDSHITEIDTGKIDADYMNSRFAKYLKELQSGDGPSKDATLAELHRSFTSLSQEDQRFAEIFLHDIQRGEVQIDPARTFRDYLVAYRVRANKNDIAAIVAALGVDPEKLTALMETHVTEVNINEYGRFDDLRRTIDAQLAKDHFERVEGRPLPMFKINIRAVNLLRDFLVRGVLSLSGVSSDIPSS